MKIRHFVENSRGKQADTPKHIGRPVIWSAFFKKKLKYPDWKRATEEVDGKIKKKNRG
jgi:hypothetical protein